MFVDLFLKTQAQQMQLVQTSLEMITYISTMYKIWFHSRVGIGSTLRLRVCSVALSAITVRLATLIMGFELPPILRDVLAATRVAA